MLRPLLAAALLLLGCGQSFQPGAAEPVSLTVRPQSVAAGSTVTLVLTNRSTAEVGYNLCSSSLERLENGVWASVPSDRVCTMELRILPPGEEVSYPLELPEGLPTGDYRFVTSAEMMEAGERGPVRSQTFRITG